MGDDKVNYRLLRYNQYSKQRGELGQANLELSGRYDQWILTLAGGALIASVTFLEKIAPQPASNTKFLIGLSWAFLIVSLLSGFLSLLTAQYSAFRQIEILDAEYKESEEIAQDVAAGKPGRTPTSHHNKFNQYTHGLNYASATGFILGVVFLCLFAFSNIPTVNPAQDSVPTKVNVSVKFDGAWPINVSHTNAIKCP